eukprot:SAG11_NODE_167_length_13647_cov_7.705049_4_plen_560_part_00
MQTLALLLSALVAAASAKTTIIVDPSPTTTTITVDSATAPSTGCSSDGPDVDGVFGFVNTVTFKSDAEAASWIAYAGSEWAATAKKAGLLEFKAVQTSGSSGYVLGIFPNNAAHYAWDAALGADENIPKMFAAIVRMDVKLWGALSHQTKEIIARWDTMPQIHIAATSAEIELAGRPDPAEAIQQVANVAFPDAAGLQAMVDAFNDPTVMSLLETAGCSWVMFRTGATTAMIYQSEPSAQAFMDTIGNEAFGAKLGPVVKNAVSLDVNNFAARAQLTGEEQAVLNAWGSAGVNFNQEVSNVGGMGCAADGPLGFVNAISYKSEADAALWITYIDEWAPMAKKMGVLDMKVVQDSPSTAGFIITFPSNSVWLSWNEYLAGDENIPKMFATISHMDVKVWGTLSYASRVAIAGWNAMPQVTVSSNEAVFALAGRPDPENAYHQLVTVAFPDAAGLQSMIDAFYDPEIYNILESTGCTWTFFRTGATTGAIYQAEPNPKAVADSIGNEAFGAKLGPVVGKMVVKDVTTFHKRKKLSKSEQEITDGWEAAGVNFNKATNVHGM